MNDQDPKGMLEAVMRNRWGDGVAMNDTLTRLLARALRGPFVLMKGRDCDEAPDEQDAADVLATPEGKAISDVIEAAMAWGDDCDHTNRSILNPEPAEPYPGYAECEHTDAILEAVDALRALDET